MVAVAVAEVAEAEAAVAAEVAVAVAEVAEVAVVAEVAEVAEVVAAEVAGRRRWRWGGGGGGGPPQDGNLKLPTCVFHAPTGRRLHVLAREPERAVVRRVDRHHRVVAPAARVLVCEP